METYDVSFIKNGVCQSNLVKTSKNTVEIKLWFKENKPSTNVIGISIATSDSMRPGKPTLTI